MENEKSVNEKSVNANAYSQYIRNPRAYIVRKWLNQLLQESYAPHDQITERIAASLATDKDMEDFGKLVGTIYQCGFNKAFNDYKKHAEKLGLKLKMSTEVQEVKSGE